METIHLPRAHFLFEQKLQSIRHGLKKTKRSQERAKNWNISDNGQRRAVRAYAALNPCRNLAFRKDGIGGEGENGYKRQDAIKDLQ